jgi:hypothetical protein
MTVLFSEMRCFQNVFVFHFSRLHRPDAALFRNCPVAMLFSAKPPNLKIVLFQIALLQIALLQNCNASNRSVSMFQTVLQNDLLQNDLLQNDPLQLKMIRFKMILPAGACRPVAPCPFRRRTAGASAQGPNKPFAPIGQKGYNNLQ